MNKIIKVVVATLSATLLLTACSSNQEKVSLTHGRVDIATDATEAEIQEHNEFVARIKKAKKRKKIMHKKHKTDSKKFCFKDNRSIHYRAANRCK